MDVNLDGHLFMSITPVAGVGDGLASTEIYGPTREGPTYLLALPP